MLVKVLIVTTYIFGGRINSELFRLKTIHNLQLNVIWGKFNATVSFHSGIFQKHWLMDKDNDQNKVVIL